MFMQIKQLKLLSWLYSSLYPQTSLQNTKMIDILLAWQ